MRIWERRPAGRLLDAQQDALAFAAPEGRQIVTEGYGRPIRTKAGRSVRVDFQRRSNAVTFATSC